MPPGTHHFPSLTLPFFLALWVACFSLAVPAAPLPPSAPVPSITAKSRTWWAFQPLRPVSPPTTDPRIHPIDAFLNSRIASQGLTPAPPADRRTRIRRATFDLTGLPPSLAETQAFLADPAPDATAFARVVDRLLASPAYGQRWARHWLDVVRYADYHDADPKARTASCEPLEAWRYRDWVVDAFNRDLPFDQFIVHQIAGDLLPDPSGGTIYPDGIIATGFLVNGAWDRGDADKEKMVSDMVDDQIDTVGKAFLGLTLGCARCHDHKFDPVSIQDYYGLAGIFYSTRIMEQLGTKGGEITLKRVPLVHRSMVATRDALLLQLEAVKAKLAGLDTIRPPLAPDHPERIRLQKERAALEAEMPPPYPVAIAAQDGGMPGGLFPNVQDVPIHVRGSYTRLGPVVPRRMPAFFAGDNLPAITQGSGRRELAAWIASPSNPLTARVIVNRVWQWHFGNGLVRTPNNLGLTSEPPSHPELLDWLAGHFIESGWSLKKLHRTLLLSDAYQRSGVVSPSPQQTDPENRWLAHFSPRRLEAEAIRDAMLWAAARLDPSLNGPAGHDLASPRRSLYVQTARWDRSSFATLFDAANPDASVDQRTLSTVAPQALFLLNHPFVQEQARHLADWVQTVEASSVDDRIDRVFERLFQRRAQPAEREPLRRLLEAPEVAGATSVWADLAHVLLCSNEFVYVD